MLSGDAAARSSRPGGRSGGGGSATAAARRERRVAGSFRVRLIPRRPVKPEPNRVSGEDSEHIFSFTQNDRSASSSEKADGVKPNRCGKHPAGSPVSVQRKRSLQQTKARERVLKAMEKMLQENKQIRGRLECLKQNNEKT